MTESRDAVNIRPCPEHGDDSVWDDGPIIGRRWWQLWRPRWVDGPREQGGCLKCDWRWDNIPSYDKAGDPVG